MNDGYLDRLAARAAGQTRVLVGPRPAALFEPAGGDAGFEVVDENVAAPPPTVPAARDPLLAPLSPPASRPVDPPSDPTLPKPTVPAPAPAPLEKELDAAPYRLRESQPDIPDARSAAAQPRTGVAAATPSEPRAGVATAMPPEPLSAPRTPESTPDVIHVTIGRVDVRATVLAPPAAASVSRERDDTVSLHDYLRGRRSR